MHQLIFLSLGGSATNYKNNIAMLSLYDVDLIAMIIFNSNMHSPFSLVLVFSTPEGNICLFVLQLVVNFVWAVN